MCLATPCVSTHAFLPFVVSTRLDCVSYLHTRPQTHRIKIDYKHFQSNASLPCHVQLSLCCRITRFVKKITSRLNAVYEYSVIVNWTNSRLFAPLAKSTIHFAILVKCGVMAGSISQTEGHSAKM